MLPSICERPMTPVRKVSALSPKRQKPTRLGHKRKPRRQGLRCPVVLVIGREPMVPHRGPAPQDIRCTRHAVFAALRGKGTNTCDVNISAMQGREVADRLPVTEVFTRAGHWSRYSYHRHDQTNFLRVSYHEETCDRRLSPDQGFGIQQVEVRDGSFDGTMAVKRNGRAVPEMAVPDRPEPQPDRAAEWLIGRRLPMRRQRHGAIFQWFNCGH